MRVVINEAQIKRNRQISHLLFFLSLAGMGIGFFYTWTAEPNSTASQMSCIILPVLMLMTLTSVRMANTWIREPRPVDVLSEALKGLGRKYTIFHYLLPAPHVLIGPEGVFTITTIWQPGPYRVAGKRWHGDEGLMRKVMGYLRQDLIGNPFSDAAYHAQQVQRIVDKVAPGQGIEVQPLIVLINPAANIEIEDPLFPVLYSDSKKKPSLRGYLKDQSYAKRATLSEQHLDRIDEMYGLLTRQQIAELSGEPLGADDDEELGEAADMSADSVVAEAPSPGAGSEPGTVFVAQLGQLFYIGATTGTVEDEIAALDLAGGSSQEVSIVHQFASENPRLAARRLQQKFERKRQKERWFGLSKKDLAWIQEQQGDSSAP